MTRIEEWNVKLMKFDKVKCRSCTWVKAITRISAGWGMKRLRAALWQKSWGYRWTKKLDMS